MMDASTSRPFATKGHAENVIQVWARGEDAADEDNFEVACIVLRSPECCTCLRIDVVCESP